MRRCQPLILDSSASVKSTKVEVYGLNCSHTVPLGRTDKYIRMVETNQSHALGHRREAVLSGVTFYSPKIYSFFTYLAYLREKYKKVLSKPGQCTGKETKSHLAGL